MFMYTTLSILKKIAVQTKWQAILLIAAIGVPEVKNIFTFIEDQKLCGYVLNFVNVLFMLKIDTCFISRILLDNL